MEIGDICEVFNGFAFKSENYVADGVRVIRISNVQKGFVEDTDPVFYPIDSKELEKFKLCKDDLLISLTGNVGRVALLDEKFLPAALNQRIACLRRKRNDVLIEYVFHCLNGDLFEQRCIASSKGVAQKNMSTEWLKKYDIPLVPFDEQKEIVCTLNNVNTMMDACKKQLAALDLLVKSRFVEMFGTFPANEKSWDVTTIREVIDEARYGSSRPAVEGGKYPYLRMNNITYGGELDLTDTKRIDIPENELPKCTVRRGDILFNRTNSKELVGKTCVYDRDELMVLAGFVIRVRVSSRVLPAFLSAFLNTNFSKRMLLNMCKAAIGQANINAQEMQNIALYVPPIELQQDFTLFKQRVDKSKLVIQQSLDKLIQLKQSLMQQYFG